MIDQRSQKAVAIGVFDATFAVTQVLNVLTILVAGIGIFCAISAIHHHRLRWQALLSAIGVGRRERLALYTMQWLILTGICLVVVWPFGLLLAALLGYVVTPVAFGWSFPLIADVAHLPSLMLTAVVCVLAAVALPGWRLMRATPAQLLKEGA